MLEKSLQGMIEHHLSLYLSGLVHKIESNMVGYTYKEN